MVKRLSKHSPCTVLLVRQAIEPLLSACLGFLGQILSLLLKFPQFLFQLVDCSSTLEGVANNERGNGKENAGLGAPLLKTRLRQFGYLMYIVFARLPSGQCVGTAQAKKGGHRHAETCFRPTRRCPGSVAGV